MKFKLVLFLVCISSLVLAQSEPPLAVGEWRSHFNHRFVSCVEVNLEDDIVWVGGEHALIEYFPDFQGTGFKDKIQGMSDEDITQMYYSEDLEKLIVIYSNSNIDIISKSSVVNFPHILNSNTIGDKKVNDVVADGDFLYMAAGLGVIVLDMNREEVKETYSILASGEPSVYSVAVTSDSLYVSTLTGIYSGSLESNLSFFSNWNQISTVKSGKVIYAEDAIWFFDGSAVHRYADGHDSLYFMIDSGYTVIDAAWDAQKLYILSQGTDFGKIFITDLSSTPSALDLDRSLLRPRDIKLKNGRIYVADYWQGLAEIVDEKSNFYFPSGPNTDNFYTGTFANNKMYFTSGGVDVALNGIGNRDGLKILEDGGWWSHLTENDDHRLDTVTDLVSVAGDLRNGSVYVGSWGGGMMELKSDGTKEFYKHDYFTLIGGNSARITDMVMDESNNLWMCNYGPGSMQGIVCKTAEGKFVGYNYNQGTGLGKIEIDPAGQIWVMSFKDGKVYCYDPAGTIENTADDRKSGEVKGMQGDAKCITMTKDGELWIGTTDGIAIIPCPEYYIEGNCDVELRVVNYDGIINAYLFDDQVVHAITVDGANRKWIGTENGAYLISENAEEVIHQFDTKNSPLPNNKVLDIVVNPVSGEVFFITESGLVSYRSDATEGIDADKNELLVFPNPVPSAYGGNIAIRGLSTDAEVKITDVKGQLVYKTIANGGQANWNGYIYTGEKAQSGVYFVYAISKDGQLTSSTKFILLQ